MELSESFLNSAEKRYMASYYHTAGLLRGWRRPYFRQHFSKNFARSVTFLLSDDSKKTIVDLGCGMGTQSLYFAFMGATVISLDLNDRSLDILEKRIKFYQRISDSDLDIRIQRSNAFDFHPDAASLFDGIHSMFAFNMMQPSESLLAHLLSCSKPLTKIAIQDGNNQSWVPRLVPSRRRKVLTPLQLEAQLGHLGFEVKRHDGAIALPPLLWTVLPSRPLLVLDHWLCRSWFWALTHHLLAERRDTQASAEDDEQSVATDNTAKEQSSVLSMSFEELIKVRGSSVFFSATNSSEWLLL